MALSNAKHPANDVSSTVARLVAFGWHNIFLWKLVQSDVFISIDQHIIN